MDPKNPKWKENMTITLTRIEWLSIRNNTFLSLKPLQNVGSSLSCSMSLVNEIDKKLISDSLIDIGDFKGRQLILV